MVKFLRLLILCLLLVVWLPIIVLVAPQPTSADQSIVDKSSPFGMVATLGNRVHTSEIDTMVGLMREAGVQWQREELFWDRLQKEPGGPFLWNGDGSGFYDYDRAIEAQVAAGINILGLLDYNPYWFKGRNPHPDEWIEDWRAFVYASVQRYGSERGWIKHWELWNEPNLRASGYESGLYEIKDFVRLLEVGYEAAKAADPEARIVMGGMSGLTETSRDYEYDALTYLQQVGELGGWNYVDIIALHPYHPAAPEAPIQRFDRSVTLYDELERLEALQQQFGAKPVWLTELGWSTSAGHPGVSELEQALYLTRAYLQAIAHPRVEKVFWYDLRNDTFPDADYANPVYDAGEIEFHYGLLRRTFPLNANGGSLRKPGFVAYRALTQILGGLQFERVVYDGHNAEVPGLYLHRYVGDGRKVDVLWRTTEALPVFTVRCSCREVLVRGWDGRVLEIVYASEEGQVSVHPNAVGMPIYIEYDPPVPLVGENERLFSESRHTLRGVFLNYWERAGDVGRFGYPLTEELIEAEAGTGRPRLVQYFERARFEHFPEHSATPYEAYSASLHLGSVALDWEPDPAREPLAEAPEACAVVEGAPYHICPPFRAVWEQTNGVAPLGLPLTEAFERTNPHTGETRLVQYFEQARLEHFPEHSGTPYEVQYGLLGRELYTSYNGMR